MKDFRAKPLAFYNYIVYYEENSATPLDRIAGKLGAAPNIFVEGYAV